MLKFRCPETAKYTAYHEAGHVVAGHGLGFTINGVVIRPDSTATTSYDDRRASLTLANLQRELVTVVAGPVAAVIKSESSDEPSPWFDPDESDVGFDLVSACLRRGEKVTDDLGQGDDLVGAYHCALQFCRLSRLADLGLWNETEGSRFERWREMKSYEMYWPHAGLRPPAVLPSDTLRTVVKAERWAERLLRRRWKAVTAVAEALYRSKNGSLTGKRALTLITAAADRPSRTKSKSSGS